jgi:hypothetical protein
MVVPDSTFFVPGFCTLLDQHGSTKFAGDPKRDPGSAYKKDPGSGLCR